jgi:hypothetical protein
LRRFIRPSLLIEAVSFTACASAGEESDGFLAILLFSEDQHRDARLGVFIL